jgi:hypothetical protein
LIAIALLPLGTARTRARVVPDAVMPVVVGLVTVAVVAVADIGPGCD